MRKADLQDSLNFLRGEDKEVGFEMFIILDKQSETVIKKADLGDGDLNKEIEEGFKSNLINRTFENDRVSLRDLSDFEDSKNDIYLYDLNDLPEGLDVIKTNLDSNFENFDFSKDSLKEIKGFLIRFSSSKEQVVVYKKHHHLSVLNQKNGIFIFGNKQRFQKPDSEQGILRFSYTIDFIYVKDQVFVYDLGCLETQFNFDEIIKNKATDKLKSIESLGFIENIEELTDFISEKSGAVNLLKLNNTSPVLSMNFDQIRDFIKGNEFLKRRFKFNTDESKITLHTNASRKYIIKLLNDDYLTSELSKTSYDSERKSKMILDEDDEN
ncbi:anti-phage protein KwaB [Algoriphagus namhaensis]